MVHPFTETPGGRLRRALAERLIAGILLFGAVLAAGGWLAVSRLRIVAARLAAAPLRMLYERLQPVGLRWPAVTTLAVAATGRYVLVRAETVLVDHYRATG